MKLTPRLQVIADFVQNNSIAADIGTDHGYIPVYLVREKNCSKVIATDVNPGPLDNAKGYIEKCGLMDKIETRLGNGLKPIKSKEVDVAIIAGMGGHLIIDILNDNLNITRSIDKFVLQPMVAAEELRKFIYENGMRIVDEKLAKEKDKMYEIFTVVHGKDEIEDSLYFEIGKKLIENKDELLEEFILRKVKEAEKISKILEKSQSQEGLNRYYALQKRYKSLLGVLEEI